MKKFLSLLLAVLTFTILSSSAASAFTLDFAENVVLSKDLPDDAYVFAGNANIDADIAGDLYVAGGLVVVNGDILEDLVVAGGKVTVMGDVAGDLRVFGGQVGIYGNVGDDIITAGGQVDIGKDSVVGGSLLAGSGILTVDGVIKEDIRGGMGMFLLNGTVVGDVVVTIEDTINISEASKIYGDLNYSAIIEASIPEGVVQGEILFNKFEEKDILKQVTYIFLIQKAISFLAALVLALILVLMAPKALVSAGKLTREGILKSFGVGVLAFLIGFIGSIVLMVTIIGIPLALIVLALLLISIYFAKIFVAAWLAGYILNFKKKVSRGKLFGGVVLALIVYYLIGYIPFVGWIINLVLFFIGVGSLLLYKKQQYAFLKSKNKV